MPTVFSALYSPGGILEILWSIGIEEQFYLFIAPLLFLVNKKHILLVLSLIGGLYFIVFHLDVFKAFSKFSLVYFNFLFGGLVSVLEEQKRLNFLKQSSLVSLLIVVLLIYSPIHSSL